MAGILTAPAVSLALRFEALHAASRDDPAPGWELRRDRLHRLRRLLTLEQGGLLAAIAADFGQRPLDELRAYELFPCVSAVDHALRHGQRWMRPQSRPVSWWAWPGRGELRHQPLGVVGIIAPWNYPLYLSVGPLVDALVAGNRALIKVSELSPAFGAALAQAVERHFRPDEVGVVQGDAAVAAEFAALPFDHLIFTGSTRIGREVLRIASAQLTPVTLELGGKSPALIGPGGDLERTAAALLRGKLVNAGQTCVAPDYVLVPRTRLDDLVRVLQRAALRADATQTQAVRRTSIINARHAQRLHDGLEQARAAGARVLPLLPPSAGQGQGRDFPPQLLLGVPPHCELMQEEIFGPLLPLVPYDTLDEAIAYINARPRPLALYVFDRQAEVIELVLAHTVSGGVTVNDTLMHLGQHALPFGGVGPSGMGAYHGETGFRRFSHAKAVFHQSRFSPIPWLRPPSGRVFRKLLSRLLGRGGPS